MLILRCVSLVFFMFSQIGRTALHKASKKGRTDICLYLIEKGADLTLTDNDGSTALHFACRGGHRETCSVLLKKGANSNAKINDGSTVLHLASRIGDTLTCSLFLDNGANSNAEKQDGSTPLHLASQGGHTETCSMLLGKGANSRAKTRDGITVLHIVSKLGHTQLCALLLDSSAEVDSKDHVGLTALHLAASVGHLDICSLLLLKGASVEAKDSNDEEPLHHASRNSHFEICFVLLTSSANLTSRSKDGKVPVDHATGETKRLLSTWTQAFVGGKTKLHVAAFNGYNAIVLMLLKNGANPNAKDNDGMTPLHKAAWEGHADTVQHLLANGADRKALDNNGKIPADYSSSKQITNHITKWSPKTPENAKGPTPKSSEIISPSSTPEPAVAAKQPSSGGATSDSVFSRMFKPLWGSSISSRSALEQSLQPTTAPSTQLIISAKDAIACSGNSSICNGIFSGGYYACNNEQVKVKLVTADKKSSLQYELDVLRKLTKTSKYFVMPFHDSLISSNEFTVTDSSGPKDSKFSNHVAMVLEKGQITLADFLRRNHQSVTHGRLIDIVCYLVYMVLD
eukprot:gene35212-45603_t